MGEIEATFYLPLEDNDGRDLAQEIAEVEAQCYVEYGAWTLHGFFQGAWRMQKGERRLDTSAVYSIVMDERELSKLEVILTDFKARTEQEAVFLKIQHHVELRLL